MCYMPSCAAVRGQDQGWDNLPMFLGGTTPLLLLRDIRIIFAELPHFYELPALFGLCDIV